MKLPIDDLLAEIRGVLRDGTSLVLEAPPGAGKTTRVPLALLGEDWLYGRRIVLLEPRRLAARAAATFMAASIGERPGRTVGWRMRMDTRVSSATRIEVVTEGVLTRLLQDDPSLDGIGVVIFDEFHERSIHADLGLAMALQARAVLRHDLRVIVMSATLDGDSVAGLLDGAPVLRGTGRMYPVETIHVPRDRMTRIEDDVSRTIRKALAEHEGDVLAFLPGASEIHATARHLENAPADVLPLFGNLSAEAQQRALEPSPPGRRKVVLATAIAETSLTIEGVRIVVDSGLMRVPRFSPRNGMTRLETIRVTRDAADQRRGRAGRTQPGICYRLWSEAEHAGLIDRRTPEILDADLAPLALELAAWGTTDPAELRWLDPPPAAAFAQARELLSELDAIDGDGRITDHGRTLAALPAHPRLAHMMARAADLGLTALACDIAALAEERDPLRDTDGIADPDIGLRIHLLRRALRHGVRAVPDPPGTARVDRAALHRVVSVARDWRRRSALAQRATVSDDTPHAGLLLAMAWPDRIARRRSARGRFVLRNGAGARVADEHTLADSEFLAIAALGGRGRDGLVQLAAPITRDDINRHFSRQIQTTLEVEWIADRHAVRSIRRTSLGAIVLAESVAAHAPRERIVSAIVEGIRTAGVDALPWTDAARSARERMRFMHAVDASWPDVSDQALMTALEQRLAPFIPASGVTTLQNVDLAALLLSLLDHRQRARFDQLAPTHFDVPSGSHIRIDYSDPNAPALPVRLQEVFGLRETPRLADGRVPLTMRLLSPAMRPVQVTRDLASFWREGYFEVRKHLRGRYPRHSWPDDPLAASPTRRTQRRPSND